jgi:prepilin-type N-terminal cleavage/methylation domain-containing protein
MMKKYSRHTHANRGFTMVEVAIVITLIGILAGGIFIGRDLIHQSELRTVMADLAKFETAVVTFRDKYVALPGDFAGAVAIWDKAGGDGSDEDCQIAPRTDKQTCDGDGNGIIGTSSIPATAVPLDETFRAWQHLKNADFIDGVFIGTRDGIDFMDLTARVVPPSKLNEAGYAFYTIDKVSQGWLNAPEGSSPIPAISIARPTNGTPAWLSDNALTALDATSIDAKIDDDKPGLGKVYMHYTGSSNCVTSDDALTAIYDADVEVVGCILHYTY